MTTSEESISVVIVIVEDHDRLARLTARHRESRGIVVTIASDGRSGITKVLEERPRSCSSTSCLPGWVGSMSVASPASASTRRSR